jgi:hypothetical protein
MKEHFKENFRNYFIVVTLINLLMLVTGKIFAPEQRFGYEVFIYPLVYGALGLIPSIFFPEKKECSMKEYVIRQIIGAIMTAIIIDGVIFTGKEMTKEYIIIALVNAVGVFVIYALVNLITWVLDSKTARELNEELTAYQEKLTPRGRG